MDEAVKRQLIDEILIANAADTESHLLEWQGLNTASAEVLRKESAESMHATIQAFSRAKNQSLIAFLKRKKLINQAIEDLS